MTVPHPAFGHHHPESAALAERVPQAIADQMNIIETPAGVVVLEGIAHREPVVTVFSRSEQDPHARLYAFIDQAPDGTRTHYLVGRIPSARPGSVHAEWVWTESVATEKPDGTVRLTELEVPLAELSHDFAGVATANLVGQQVREVMVDSRAVDTPLHDGDAPLRTWEAGTRMENPPPIAALTDEQYEQAIIVHTVLDAVARGQQQAREGVAA